MASIDILDTGIVFRGNEEDAHFRNAFFPSVVELPDRTLVAAMDIGQRMETLEVEPDVVLVVYPESTGEFRPSYVRAQRIRITPEGPVPQKEN